MQPGTTIRAPQIQFKPGLADEMLRELAPLLAEEGIDVDNIDVPDLDTLQAALNREVERLNMARFPLLDRPATWPSPTLRLAVEAIAEGNTTLAGVILEQVQPDSPGQHLRHRRRLHRSHPGLLDKVAHRQRSPSTERTRSTSEIAHVPLAQPTCSNRHPPRSGSRPLVWDVEIMTGTDTRGRLLTCHLRPAREGRPPPARCGVGRTRRPGSRRIPGYVPGTPSRTTAPP